MRWGIRGILAGVGVLLLSALPSEAIADFDLGTLLAPPPGSDWIDVGSTPSTLSGSFTSHDYAAYLKSSGTNATLTEGILNRYGFRAGFAGWWEQRTTQNQLIERVFVFGGSQGANDWYAILKRQALTSSEYHGEVGTADIPNSFGVDLEGPTGIHSDRVEFVKGNMVFVVHADAETGNGLSVLAVQQAKKEYQNAPSTVAVAQRSGSPLNTTTALLVGGAIAAFGVAGALVLALILITRRRQMPAGAPISPDGHYWWDGQAWRPRLPGPAGHLPIDGEELRS